MLVTYQLYILDPRFVPRLYSGLPLQRLRLYQKSFSNNIFSFIIYNGYDNISL